MKYPQLAALGAVALAAALLAGCSSPPPQEHIAIVTPPVVAVSPAPNPPQTFRSTIGMTPAEEAGVLHLQSFAGDVCVQDSKGNAAISHCVCQQTNCNCQYTGVTCNP